MRTIRGKDKHWEIRKYSDDVALYAHCKCGFEYICSTSIRDRSGHWSFEQAITKIFRYCPNCGSHKRLYNPNPIKIKENNDNDFLNKGTNSTC